MTGTAFSSWPAARGVHSSAPPRSVRVAFVALVVALLAGVAEAIEEADGTTSPEELIAAAHSSCYAMALSAQIGNAGGTPESLDVTADVTLGPDPAGGFRITGIKLTVRGRVSGIDGDGFQAAAEAAKAGCPVSKALAGVDHITLDAALA
ncbi:OsmC family peroxiredoxin [Nocardia gipuzkoensis]|uniref:OsmC family peroxiredoxin n=1 Tax=Nocardia gipuzkoensis TaxID=2749991 RepID=UPI003EDF7516